MPLEIDPIISLPGFRLLEMKHHASDVFELKAVYEGEIKCPRCSCLKAWVRARKRRRVRHESFGLRPCRIVFEHIKYQCLGCRRFFYPRYKGIGSYQRSSERFKKEVVEQHHKGIAQSQLAKDYRMGTATIERWYHVFSKVKLRELKNRECPRVIGVDEHFFTRKEGYATTIADLTKHKVFDVRMGRSEKSLEPYLKKLQGKERVRVAVMDLSETYRSIVGKHFPNAKIVADRFHVVRLINHHFMKCWGSFDPAGRKHRGLTCLMRQHHWRMRIESQHKLECYLGKHPILREVYFFKQKLAALMCEKSHTRKSARPLVYEFLKMIEELKSTSNESLRVLGETLENWKEEIARMWRFTKTNSITEGLHTKMEMLSRRAFGFKSFENYRIRVLVHCGY
jgi:transposase